MSSPSCICRICGNGRANLSHVAREMMFGTREEFAYIECSECGCLTIRDIPHDMSRYYPDGYYSMRVSRIDMAMFFLASFMVRLYLSSSLARSVLTPWIDMDKFSWMLHVHLKKSSRILDVGCGAGKLLLVMRHLGFSHLAGIDPFLSGDIRYGSGVQVFKKDLHDLDGSFDLVMLHHSFEHMPDPIATLHELNRLLAPDGVLALRMPVAQTYAWRTYRTDWVQLDAPRHITLYSRRGMEILARQTGFRIDKVVFDSTGFQFWGSEQYSKGISLTDSRSYKTSPLKSIFSMKDICRFKIHARELNRCSDGDQACFFLSRG